MTDTLTYLAEYAPVYWEPIVLSGERITALIAVAGHDGNVLVERVLREDVLRLFYPGQEQGVGAMLEMVRVSLHQHLAAIGSFAGWRPPLTGFFLGEANKTQADVLAAVPAQVAALCASLATVHLAEDVDEEGQAISFSENRWRQDVKTIATTRLARIKDNFSLDFYIAEGARKTVIDYVSARQVINLGLIHASAIKRTLNDTKAKVLDLAALRDSDHLLSNDARYAVMVWRPTEADYGLSDRQLKTVGEAFHQLETEGNRLGIVIKGYSQADKAAEDLVLREVA